MAIPQHPPEESKTHTGLDSIDEPAAPTEPIDLQLDFDALVSQMRGIEADMARLTSMGIVQEDAAALLGVSLRAAERALRTARKRLRAAGI